MEMALAAAQNDSPYGLALLDGQMPEIDGLHLAEMLHNNDAIPKMPMVLLSSTPIDETDILSQHPYIDHSLNKPIRHQQLLDVLRSLFGARTTIQCPESNSASSLGTATPSLVGRVLLAEDNKVNQEVVVNTLRGMGVRVDVASDGLEALNALARQPYDLVLMDCHMPRMDGFEATEAYRRTEAEGSLKRVPIIACTADVRQDIRERCEQAGMDDYISKPYKNLQMWNLLSKWLPQVNATTPSGLDNSQADPPEAPSTDVSELPAVFDPDPLEQLREISGDQGNATVAAIVEVYQQQLTELSSVLRDSVAAKNLDTVFKTAHTFKSSSANVGAMRLSLYCAELEAAARAGQTEPIDPLLKLILGQETQVKKALDTYQNESTETVTVGVVTEYRESTATRESILLIDDDPVFSMSLGEHLKASDFDVTLSGSGADGVAKAKTLNPGVILLDAIMEPMDGFDCCLHLREIPTCANTPIIILTGLEDVDSVAGAFAAGATDFASKPVNHPLLIERIRFVLRSSSMASQLLEQQSQLASAQRLAKLGYWRWNAGENDLILSEELVEMCGRRPGQTILSLEDYLALIDDDNRDQARHVFERAQKHGDAIAIDYLLQPAGRAPINIKQEVQFNSNGANFIMGTVQDVTESKAAEEHIRRLAYFDGLTNLASRGYFQQRLENTIRAAKRRGEKCALLYLDLDSFKDVNDSLGYDMGDELLIVIANRLHAVLRDTDFPARLGGDEFCLILDNIADEYAAAEVAERCLAEIHLPVEIGTIAISPRASIGIAMYPRDAITSVALLKAADNAMYEAKNSGKHRYAFYSEGMTAAAEERLLMEQELREAINNEDFELVYQPQIDIQTGRMIGVESLARWPHPERGMVSPGIFIPILERLGLIDRLGDWALRRACEQMVEWLQAGLPEFRVAVNISALHFSDPALLEEVRKVLAQTGLTPSLLELEITESAIQTTPEHLDILHEIRALGVQIAVDDFGTGYSSLASLKHLTIDSLKIDRIFITEVDVDGNDQLMVKTIIGIGQSMNSHLVAEGVETRPQLDKLIEMGCDVVQGFYFSKPVAPEAIAELAQRNFLE